MKLRVLSGSRSHKALYAVVISFNFCFPISGLNHLAQGYASNRGQVKGFLKKINVNMQIIEA